MIFTNINDKLQNSSLTKDIQFCIDYAEKNREKILSLENGSYDVDYNGIKMNVGNILQRRKMINFGKAIRDIWMCKL